MSTKNNSNTIELNRIYNAPLKLAWNAWTDPAQAAHWWGPRGFTITTHKHDLKTGGTWDYTMHGPDGVNYPNITKYLEVENYSRLLYDHGGNADQPPMFRVDVKFTEIKNQTHMTMSMIFDTPETAARSRIFIKQAGGNSTWDRFAEYLEKQQTQKEIFTINRSFDISIEKMFEVWTSADHISKWLPPAGFTMQFIKADIKVGGETFYVMTNGKDTTMYGQAKYLEIKKPNLIIYTQQFCDKDQNVTRHPMAPTWPETMLTTVTLYSEGSEQTRVTITWEAFGPVTDAELQTFISARAGMTQGWTGSLDKLEDYTEKI